MKTNDLVLFRRADGRVFSAAIVDVLADGNLFLRYQDSNQHTPAPASECISLPDAFDAFLLQPVLKGLLEAAAVRAVTAPAAPALDASQPGQSPAASPELASLQRDAAPVTGPGTVTAGESQSAAPSPKAARAATKPKSKRK